MAAIVGYRAGWHVLEIAPRSVPEAECGLARTETLGTRKEKEAVRTRKHVAPGELRSVLAEPPPSEFDVYRKFIASAQNAASVWAFRMETASDYDAATQRRLRAERTGRRLREFVDKIEREEAQ